MNRLREVVFAGALTAATAAGFAGAHSAAAEVPKAVATECADPYTCPPPEVPPAKPQVFEHPNTGAETFGIPVSEVAEIAAGATIAGLALAVAFRRRHN